MPTLQTSIEDQKRKLHTGEARFAVIGLGYVGLPLAKGLAARGFEVLGIEQQLKKVHLVNSGVDYIEPETGDLPKLLTRFQATTNFGVIEKVDVVIICVPTPLNRNLEPDISYVRKVSQKIGEHIQSGTLVILESTTYPGTTEEVVRPQVESGGRVRAPGRDYCLAFSPERVDPGNPHYNTTNTPKVIGGSTPTCAELAGLVYEKLLGDPNLVKLASSTRAAEMEKLFENIFRSVNIALVNELALICRAMNLDVWEIIELASSKPYGFMPFWPGPGIGGHCIPLDPFYLSWKAREFDFRTRFIELAGELNSCMPRHVVELAGEALGEHGLKGARVLIAGVAYKPDISDCRESPALKIMDLLQKRGAVLSFYDPKVGRVSLKNGVELASESQLEDSTYDLVILLTVHRDMDVSQLCSLAPKVVDTRGATRGLEIEADVLVLGAGALQ